MSVTITSSQWAALADINEKQAEGFDTSSETYQALIAAANAEDTAAKYPANYALSVAAAEAQLIAYTALQNDSTASATLESYEIDQSTVLDIPNPENTDTNGDLLISKLTAVSTPTYADGTTEADLAAIMMLLLEFAQVAKTAVRNERNSALASALADLQNAADKIHDAALDRYKGAIGKAVFEIAGAATTIVSSVCLVKSMQADAEPIPPTRGTETDAEFQARLTQYESNPKYQAALKDGPAAVTTYEADNPRPTQLKPAPGTDLNKTTAQYEQEVRDYESNPAYKDPATQADYERNNPRPTRPAESDDHWEERENAYKARSQEHIQANNMKQTMLMTYSQLTGAIGQLVSAPGGVFEAAYNLKAADDETEQKKLEADAQMQNAKADDAQSTKQSMGESISNINGTLKDILKDIHDLMMSIVRAV